MCADCVPDSGQEVSYGLEGWAAHFTRTPRLDGSYFSRPRAGNRNIVYTNAVLHSASRPAGRPLSTRAMTVASSSKLRKSLKLIRVTCYTIPPYGIHFKCVLNFGD
jgi:hypothetical protein